MNIGQFIKSTVEEINTSIRQLNGSGIRVVTSSVDVKTRGERYTELQDGSIVMNIQFSLSVEVEEHLDATGGIGLKIAKAGVESPFGSSTTNTISFTLPVSFHKPNDTPSLQ